MASLDASIDLRPRTIFDHFDVNEDGKLNFEELNALQVKTSGVAMTRPQWAQVCETFQIKPDSAGLTFDHILMTYATDQANIDDDFKAVFPHLAKPLTPVELATDHLRGREENFLSEPLLLTLAKTTSPSSSSEVAHINTGGGDGGSSGGSGSKGGVDLAGLDVAAFVNQACAKGDTKFELARGSEAKAAFNKRWRTALKVHFASAGATSELDDWLATGKSHGRQLRLQVMALKPNNWFKLHAHPNIEFEMTLAGSLKEVRLVKGAPKAPSRYPEEIEASLDDAAAAAAAADVLWPLPSVVAEVTSLIGPDLSSLHRAKKDDGGGGGSNKAAVAGEAAMTADASKGGASEEKGEEEVDDDDNDGEKGLESAMQLLKVDEDLEFEEKEVPAGKFIANTIGSVHQSYTGDEGALILVLWSGCHANITPEKCAGLCESVAQGGCKGGSLLRPEEGWAK